MNYAVIGTGGIGGYYGSRLAQSGRDDTIVILIQRCLKPSCASGS